MLYVDASVCDRCGACVSVCPENALMLTDSIHVTQQRCVACGRCVTVCPYGACSLHKDPE